MQTSETTVERREWATIDQKGKKLFAVLHRPLDVARPPLVLFFHGFASSKHGSNRCYVALSEALSREGIASLRCDFRGSGDSEGSLHHASFHDLMADALAILAYGHGVEGIDPERIGLFGSSLGGTLAVQTSAVTQRVRALALWSPVASGELWFRDFLMKYPELRHASPSDILNTYRRVHISPLFKEQFAQLFAYKTFGELHQIPILHMHGEKDTMVSIAHQEAFRTCAGPNVRFLTYPGEEHSLGYSPSLPEILQEVTHFFKEHL